MILRVPSLPIITLLGQFVATSIPPTLLSSPPLPSPTHLRLLDQTSSTPRRVGDPTTAAAFAGAAEPRPPKAIVGCCLVVVGPSGGHPFHPSRHSPSPSPSPPAILDFRCIRARARSSPFTFRQSVALRSFMYFRHAHTVV